MRHLWSFYMARARKGKRIFSRQILWLTLASIREQLHLIEITTKKVLMEFVSTPRFHNWDGIQEHVKCSGWSPVDKSVNQLLNAPSYHWWQCSWSWLAIWIMTARFINYCHPFYQLRWLETRSRHLHVTRVINFRPFEFIFCSHWFLQLSSMY